MSAKFTEEKKQDVNAASDGGEKDRPVNPAEIEVPASLPVLPVHGFVFFPGMGFPLNISNEVSRKLIDDAVVGERLIAIVSHKPEIEEKDRPKDHELFRVGVMGYIHKMVKNDQNIYQVLISAVRRLRILEYLDTSPYLTAKVEAIPSDFANDTELDALILHLQGQFKKLVELTGAPGELLMTVNSINDPFQIAYLVSSQLNLDLAEEQHLLEISNIKVLLNRVARNLNKRLETLEVAGEIQKSVKEDTDSRQREFFLRQQLKAIRKELGEDDENVEIRELEAKIAEAPLSEEARETAAKELNRLKRISPSSP